MDDFNSSDFSKFAKPFPARVISKPLGVKNVASSDGQACFASLPTSPTNAKKALFEMRNKENDESIQCKYLLCDKEISGISPVVVPQRSKSERNSNETQEELRKIKPRKSMLGRRRSIASTRHSITKDDATYTLSKPLFSSSPLASGGSDSYKPQTKQEPRKLQKAASSPCLSHPFDTTDDADVSAFFSKEHSENTWSVFKSTKNSSKLWNKFKENTTSQIPSMKGLPSRPLFDQHALTLESNRKDINSSNLSKDVTKSYQTAKTLDMDQEFSTHYIRTRAQARKAKKEGFVHIPPIEEEHIRENLNAHSQSSAGVTENTEGTPDSFTKMEEIVAINCKDNLLKENEEDLKRLSNPSSQGENESDSYISANEDPDNEKFHKLCSILRELKEEKDEVDKNMEEVNKKMEKFNKKWQDMVSFLETFENNPSQIACTVPKIKQSNNYKKKRTVNHKGGRSLDRGPSATPNSGSSEPLDQITKNLTGLKLKFNCLNTPVGKSNDSRQLRKSVCYTPKTLSNLVGDQVKDIFGDS